MKLTINELRRIISEEIAASAPPARWSTRKTARSEPEDVAAAMSSLLGAPAEELLAVAERVVQWADEVREAGSYDEVYESDAREDIGAALGPLPPTALETVMDTFLGDAEWTETPEDEEEDPLRAKWPEAFTACDNNTRSEKAEADWSFYEAAPPEFFAGKKHRPKVTLWADPNVSGDSMWWDPKAFAGGGAWKEDDGSLVWRD